MKWMPLLLLVLFAACKKDGPATGTEIKSEMKATINGTAATTFDISVQKDAAGELTQFSGQFPDGSVIGVRMSANLAFTPGTYAVKPGDANPATLTSFTAQAVGNKVKLAWSTAQEQDMQRFEVERSFNAQSFTMIGTVAAAGNTTTPSNYAYDDPNPQAVNYYRLRMVDASGFSYSSVKRVDVTSSYSVYLAQGSNTYYGSNGNLQILSHDRVKHIVTGSFTFDAATQGAMMHEVRSGSFTVKY